MAFSYVLSFLWFCLAFFKSSSTSPFSSVQWPILSPVVSLLHSYYMCCITLWNLPFVSGFFSISSALLSFLTYLHSLIHKKHRFNHKRHRWTYERKQEICLVEYRLPLLICVFYYHLFPCKIHVSSIKRCLTLHCEYVPHFYYLVICWWTHKLILFHCYYIFFKKASNTMSKYLWSLFAPSDTAGLGYVVILFLVFFFF